VGETLQAHFKPATPRGARRFLPLVFLALLPQPLARGAVPDPPPLAGPPAPPVKAELLLKEPERLLLLLRERNGEVAAQAARVDQSRADLGASKLFANPGLDFSLGDINVGRSNPPGLGFNQTSVYGVGVSSLVELGKRGPRMESARLREEATQEVFRGVLSQKAAEARRAIARAVYLRARQTTLEENLDSARKVVDLERTRLEHGDLSRNDFDRLLLDTTSLEVEVSRNRAELETSLGDARALLYAPLDTEGARMEDLDGAPLLPGQPGDMEEAIQHRPDVEALRLQEASSRQDLKLARRRVIPDLNLRVGYTHDNLLASGDQEDTLGFSVAIPIPLFDRGQYDAARAQGRALEASHLARTLIAEAQSDLTELQAKRNFLETSLDRLTRDSITRSSEVLDTTLKAFNRGQVSMTDLILARRTHLGLVLNVMDLRFEYFNVKNDLRRVLGLDAQLQGRPVREDHR
jgi:cobalt-zinc-cadmium efflux system outer membrane protein